VSQVDRHVVEKIELLKYLNVINNDHIVNEVHLVTRQTLAPNYNETVQILDFLDSITELSKLDTPAPKTPI
jgi:hypothetical protein